MADYEDFYIEGNILGYTGDLQGNPTVYFTCIDGVGQFQGQAQALVKFGHITQVHDLPFNIGREKPKRAFSYSIANVSDGKGGQVSQESIHGSESRKPANTDDGFRQFHTSRSTFKSASNANIAILARAIANFPNKKRMYAPDFDKQAEYRKHGLIK